MRVFKGFVCAAAMLALAIGAGTHPAQAGAPMVKTQAPGFYRLMIGDFEVTALLDGTMMIPLKSFLNDVTQVQLEHALARDFLKDPVELSVNAFLVNTGTKLVLVDTGLAGAMEGTGHLQENLRAAGCQGSFQKAQEVFEPYIRAGKFSPFDGDIELVPGMHAVATHGHTPGHTCYLIESRGERMLFVGDLLHVASVQFDNPAITIKFDTDSAAARTQRQRIFREAAANGEWIAAAHLPFPGVGHARTEGKGYAFVPANYAMPR